VLSLREASYALFGAWRLAHFDLQGTAYFDRSAEGALRSFWAAAILLPAYAVMVLLHMSETPPVLGWGALVVVHGVAYLVGWTAFPVAMLWLARLLDREEEYFGYVAMYNWAQVLVTLVVLPMAAVRTGQLLPEGLSSILGFAVDLAMLAYLWFIARAGLRVGPFAAMGVVVFDLTLSLMIWSVADGLSAGGRLF
jgi:hypothetical protein